jgi:hypothetical protein
MSDFGGLMRCHWLVRPSFDFLIIAANARISASSANAAARGRHLRKRQALPEWRAAIADEP